MITVQKGRKARPVAIAGDPGRGWRHAALFPELPVPLRLHPLRRLERILVHCAVMPNRVEIIRICNAARGVESLLDDPAAD